MHTYTAAVIAPAVSEIALLCDNFSGISLEIKRSFVLSHLPRLAAVVQATSNTDVFAPRSAAFHVANLPG
jgi:hypothetical protein